MGEPPFETGESAVAVPVPAAEPIVSSHRSRLDSSAAYGIPAHVTVLYPFLPAPRLTAAVLEQLRDEHGSVPPLEVTFRRVGRMGQVLYLAPEPAEPFEELTARFARRWPEAPPYGGVHEKVIAHLTIADSGSDELLESIAGEMAARLPLRTTLDEAVLYVFEGRSWQVRQRFSFAGDRPSASSAPGPVTRLWRGSRPRRGGPPAAPRSRAR